MIITESASSLFKPTNIFLVLKAHILLWSSLNPYVYSLAMRKQIATECLVVPNKLHYMKLVGRFYGLKLDSASSVDKKSLTNTFLVLFAAMACNL